MAENENNNHSFPDISGLRMTKHRQEVYSVLRSTPNHPTASEIYECIKEHSPDIVLATVYNCLDALVDYGAVKQVNFAREPSRYCANLIEHGHFHDQNSGTIHDVTFKEGVSLTDFLHLPEGCEVKDLEITLRGTITK